ncbi:hypothetical protein AAGG74_19135 [Bacillus mexicanus]|uniref:hypothetical protein n=1 Tax=Bacillus mexicanus TaxID=2834415 RepID=UPI003D249036
MISTKELDNMFMNCLYEKTEVIDGKVPEDAIVVQGIVNCFALHPLRTRMYKETIKKYLGEISVDLSKGQHFLNLCYDKKNYQWGDHRQVEQLVVLSIANNLLEYTLPKEYWGLTKGLPFVITTKE